MLYPEFQNCSQWKCSVSTPLNTSVFRNRDNFQLSKPRPTKVDEYFYFENQSRPSFFLNIRFAFRETAYTFDTTRFPKLHRSHHLTSFHTLFGALWGWFLMKAPPLAAHRDYCSQKRFYKVKVFLKSLRQPIDKPLLDQ